MSVVYELWVLVYKALGISWVMAGSVKEELWVWGFLKNRCLFADVIPLSILWTA